MDHILQRLGKRIRDIRIQRGFASQEALADFLKVHRTFVGHLETGRKDFRLSTIIRIAGELGVPLSELFAGVESDEPVKAWRGKGTVSKTKHALLRELDAMERTLEKIKTLVAS